LCVADEICNHRTRQWACLGARSVCAFVFHSCSSPLSGSNAHSLRTLPLALTEAPGLLPAGLLVILPMSAVELLEEGSVPHVRLQVLGPPGSEDYNGSAGPATEKPLVDDAPASMVWLSSKVPCVAGDRLGAQSSSTTQRSGDLAVALTTPTEGAACPAAAELTSQSDFEAEEEEEEDDELAEVQDSFVLTTAQSLVARRTQPIASGANLQELTLEAERMVEAAFGQLEPEFATSAIRAGVFDYLRENGCMTPRALRVSFQLATNERYMRKSLVRAGAPDKLACALKRILNQ